MNKFNVERMIEGRSLSFFDTLSKQKLATFVSWNKKKVIKSNAKTISIANSRDLFSKVAIIAQTRSINLKELFVYFCLFTFVCLLSFEEITEVFIASQNRGWCFAFHSNPYRTYLYCRWNGICSKNPGERSQL